MATAESGGRQLGQEQIRRDQMRRDQVRQEPRGFRSRLGFGLRGPRRIRHELPEEQLTAVGLPVGDDGIVIGVDAENQPAVLGINRPTPLDIVLVGGLWMAQVIALRAAATGARIAVESGRTQTWASLAQAAGGGQQCVTLHDVGQVPPQGASVGSPVMVVRDAGIRPPRGRVPAAPWQSVLTLLPYLGPTAPRFLEGATLVGLQRLSPPEAGVIGKIMGLPAQETQKLPKLGDDVVLWCTRKHRRFVVVQPTDTETGLLGAPHRVD